jgi:hypothetical protein
MLYILRDIQGFNAHILCFIIVFTARWAESGCDAGGFYER